MRIAGLNQIARLVLFFGMLAGQISGDSQELQAAQSQSKASDVKELLTQVNSLYSAKKYREAIELLNKVLELDPQNGQAFRSRAVCYFELKRYREALPDYEAAARLIPKDARVYVGRASTKKILLKDLQGALDDYNTALELNPQHADAYQSRGSLKFEMNDLAGAEQDCSKALEIKTSDTESHNCLGRIDVKRKAYDKAIEHFSRAIELNPKYSYGFHNRAIALNALGKKEEALEDCRKALEINPSYAAAQGLMDKIASSKSSATAANEKPVFLPAQPSNPMPPLALAQPLDINTLTAQRYKSMVEAAMEAMRLLQGNLTPEEEKQFNAAWLPLFDFPTPEGIEYFQKLNPLLVEFLSLRTTIYQASEEFEDAWAEATVAAGYESSQGVEEAMATAGQQKNILLSANARMDQIVKAIGALGNPPLPQEAKSRAKKAHDEAFRIINALTQKKKASGTGRPVERKGLIVLSAPVDEVEGGTWVEITAKAPPEVAVKTKAYQWIWLSKQSSDKPDTTVPRKSIYISAANSGYEVSGVTVYALDAAGKRLAEGLIRIPFRKMKIQANAPPPFQGKTYEVYSYPQFQMEMNTGERSLGEVTRLRTNAIFKVGFTTYQHEGILEAINGIKDSYAHHLVNVPFNEEHSRTSYNLKLGNFAGDVYEMTVVNKPSHGFGILTRGYGYLLAPNSPEHIQVEYEIGVNCTACRVSDKEDHSGQARAEARQTLQQVVSTMMAARFVPEGSVPNPVEITEEKEEPIDPKARAEAIAMHEANIKILEKNLSRNTEDLAKATEVYQRESLDFRILTGKAEIQAEKDLIASLQSGQIVHTRTEYDDYVKGAFIANIRVNQEKMEAARRQLAEAQRLAALLPEGEAENARSFIERQLTPEVVAKADLDKIKEVRDALFLKADGYRQKVEAMKEGAEAERALMVLEGARTAGAMAAMFLGGERAASAYSGFTGLLAGGPVEAVKGAASWYSTGGYVAAEAIDGFFEGGRWSKDGFAGAVEKGATALVMGKLFEYGIKKTGSVINSLGKKMERMEISYRTGKTEQELLKDMARYQRELQEGKKLAFELEQIERQIISSKASGKPVQGLEDLAFKKAAEINSNFYAKKYVKFRGGAEIEMAAVRHTERIYKKVDEEFARLMKEKGWDMNKLRFKEFRNASSKGFGMDRDYGVVDRGATLKAVVGKDGKPVLGSDGKPLMVQKDPWLIKDNKPSSIIEIQKDGSDAYKKAYESVTGQNSQKSFQTFTTRIHKESFADLRVLKDLKNPENVRLLKTIWGEQTARTIELKGLEMLNDPHLSKIAGYQEACRGLAKEIDKKLIPFLEASNAGKGMDVEKLQQTQKHLRELQKVFEEFAVDKIDPIKASQKIREITGGKDLPEILDQVRNITEAVFKFGGVGR